MSLRFKYLTLGAVALLILSIYVFLGGGNASLLANAQGGPPPAPPVTTMTVSPESVEVWSDFSARLMAVDQADIRPRVGGEIMQVHFKDGDVVRKGDRLFTIDTRPFRATLAQTNAALVAANTNLDLKKIELQRAKKLIESRAIPQRVYDERVNAYSVAKSTKDGAYAAHQKARLDVEYANVLAPISGRTGRVELTAGNIVNAGANAPLLTTIVSDTHIYADFEVDEATYVDLVRQGLVGGDATLPVHLFLTGSEEPDYVGDVYNFDNRIDAASGTIRARAKFANDRGLLVPGMFANVAIQAAGGGQQIVVPERAIGTDQDRKFVYIVNDQNMSEYREIKIGASADNGRIVLDGLSDGDVVITEGIVRIQPGMPVNTGAPNKAAVEPEPEQMQESDPMPLLEEKAPEAVAVEDSAVDEAVSETSPEAEPSQSRFLDSSGAEISPASDELVEPQTSVPTSAEEVAE